MRSSCPRPLQGQGTDTAVRGGPFGGRSPRGPDKEAGRAQWGSLDDRVAQGRGASEPRGGRGRGGVPGREDKDSPPERRDQGGMSTENSVSLGAEERGSAAVDGTSPG